ncbi:MAG: transposase [Cyclobacteriaceae bacterium]
MNAIQEFIKEYSHLTSSETSIVHRDNDGKIYTSSEDAYKAKKAGKTIELININDSALEELKEIGIDNKSDAAKFIDLVSKVFSIDSSGKMKTKRKTYTESEKKAIVKKWGEAEKTGLSKADFCRQNDISYQNLMKWVKDSK